LTHHWWWETIVMPHQVWLLLLLSGVLLCEMIMNRDSPEEQSNSTLP